MQSFILKEDHQVSCFPRVLLFRKVSLLTPTAGVWSWSRGGFGAGEGKGGQERRRGGPTG